MIDPTKLEAEDQYKLDDICRHSTALEALARHVHDFADMMHKLRGDLLPQWIAAVLANDLTQLHSIANGLQRGLIAVTAGNPKNAQ